MKNVLALEMRKAFRNRSFLAVVLIGCVLGLLSAWMCLMQYGQDTYYFQIEADSGYISNPMLEVESFYTYWIVMDGFTLFSSLLFYLLPLFATLPYAWSYCQERNRAYERNLVVRCGRYRYYFGKYIAAFLSGGLAVVLPVLLNILVMAMFLPARTPQVDYTIYYGVSYGDLFSAVFYTYPALYVLLRVLLIFLFGGLLAVFGMSVAYFTRNRVAVLVTPFFCCVALQVLGQALYSYMADSALLSPINFLGQSGDFSRPLWPALLEGGILLAGTLLLTWMRGRKHEIY